VVGFTISLQIRDVIRALAILAWRIRPNLGPPGIFGHRRPGWREVTVRK